MSFNPTIVPCLSHSVAIRTQIRMDIKFPAMIITGTRAKRQHSSVLYRVGRRLGGMLQCFTCLTVAYSSSIYAVSQKD